MNQTTRFVTAVRNDAGQLQMDVWEADGNGQLHRKGKALFGSVSNSSSIPKRIAIDTQGAGSNSGLSLFAVVEERPALSLWRQGL